MVGSQEISAAGVDAIEIDTARRVSTVEPVVVEVQIGKRDGHEDHSKQYSSCNARER